MSTILSFKSIESKLGVARGKDCMKKFCKSLREYAMEIINFGKKKMKLLTSEQQKSCENTKVAIFVKIKNIVKIWNIAIIQGNIEVLHIAYII